MAKKTRVAAFTLIELLVVIAIIALLISILLPALSGAREQGKKAKCLANLKSIGSSMHQYATEDSKELLIPIHENMVQSVPFWLWRCVNWFAWGGRSAQAVFKTGGSGGYMLADVTSAPGAIARPEYDARRRPLNRYIYRNVEAADAKSLEGFHCPSDTGYPSHPDIDDSPAANAERPCYDTIGNSYRGSLCMITLGSDNSPSFGHFSLGPWGHRVSTIPDVGKVVLAGEPAFFNMIGKDISGPLPDPVLTTGWHRKPMIENLLFCDGSARATRAEKQVGVDPAGADRLNVYQGGGLDANHLLVRGSAWRLDVYPTAGSRIFGSNQQWAQSLGIGYGTKWPFMGHQEVGP